jgi:dTDP-4-dehydrorhamnose 3,5-epimerase
VIGDKMIVIIKFKHIFMINDVIIKNLNKYEDQRGWLTEIYRQDELKYQPAMGYISATKPGVARGPHEHKFQSDCFVFVGPGSFDLYLWDRREDSSTKGEHVKITVGENNPTMVIVPPGVVHGYKCVSTVDAYSLNLPDKLYKGENKSDEIDEVRWEVDPMSPYKIK